MPTANDPHSKSIPGKQLLLGALFGAIFGFLLQKGGVAKYHLLVGVLLFEDPTVIQVMMTAVIVGMIGIHAMAALGLIHLHIKPTRYAANIIGGLIFGIGFGIAGYCPGTQAAALGQGNFDAAAGMLGMVVGSYLFAEVSGLLDRTVNTWGNRGELTLPQLLHARVLPFIVGWALILVGVLTLLAMLD